MAAKVCHDLFIYCVFFLFLLLSQGHLSDSQEEEEPSPFAFIKQLHGFKKGDNVEGLHKLKQYLEYFGYLSYPHSKNQTRANDDGLLESAIKTYQLNFRLNVTGILDADTVATMMKPRCGVPDIINGTNWMQKGSYYAFFPGKPKWPKLRLTYAIKSNTHRAAYSPIRQAFAKWASVSRLSFTGAQSYRSADLRLSFERGDHGDNHPFNGRSGVLAHAFPPTDGRLHFNGDERWAVGAVYGAFDIGTVALHEIGHLLGLDHSNDPYSIMYPSADIGRTKGLNSDDIRGIRTLYRS